MVLSATNRDLMQLVRKGTFREDLYFRLNVVTISVPPLRERASDIADLAVFFLEKFNRERNRQLTFSPGALKELKSYDFPGNVRELRNIIEDAFVFTEGKIIEARNLSFRKGPLLEHRKSSDETEKLPAEFFDHNLKDATFLFEKMYFQYLLETSHWNISEVARITGMQRESLSRKLKRLGLSKP
jgi:DNA-binding NtrC family response regulator